MLNVLNAGAWLLAGTLSVVIIYLCVELCFGLLPSKRRRLEASTVHQKGAILVPAHNEAISIAATVSALRIAAPQCRILVVADNCTDDTADLARGAGAEAITRVSDTHKGKGFALAFGRDHLAKAPPDAVIIVDADCRLSPGSAEILIARSVEGNQPVQGVNLLVTGATESPIASISNFAMLIKNLVRARGLARLGGGTLLFGTGMAFPWNLFAELDLATSHAVEDLQLGLSLAKQGTRVGFEDRALVTSPAASVADSKGQRSRWEHGFMQTAMHNGLPMLLSGLSKGSRHLLTIGAHMMVPPLAMLMLLTVVALLLLTSLVWLGSGSVGPLMLLGTSLTILSVILLAAWWAEGRRVISGAALLKIPFYILWKVPIYIRFFTARQTGWNRTQRDGEHH
ncbi:glycosyltransferase family 2 protein [Sphingorhabdus sp.]|uniref:glycosyltransferase family 2 protein n=1 Tax=Sphingorhabdus sp. TaxID=1902408 RepID=UPI00391BE829